MIYRFEDAELDADAFQLRVAGESVPVEPQVFEVLRYLIEHRDRLCPRAEILDSVWGDRFVSDSALEAACSFVLDSADIADHRNPELSLRPTDSADASDHFPIVADLIWKE